MKSHEVAIYYLGFEFDAIDVRNMESPCIIDVFVSCLSYMSIDRNFFAIPEDFHIFDMKKRPSAGVEEGE